MYDGGGPVVGGAVAGVSTLAMTGASTFGITMAIVLLMLGLLLVVRARYLTRKHAEALAAGSAAERPSTRPGAGGTGGPR